MSYQGPSVALPNRSASSQSSLSSVLERSEKHDEELDVAAENQNTKKKKDIDEDKNAEEKKRNEQLALQHFAATMRRTMPLDQHLLACVAAVRDRWLRSQVIVKDSKGWVFLQL